jgi:hypothetical protein
MNTRLTTTNNNGPHHQRVGFGDCIRPSIMSAQTGTSRMSCRISNVSLRRLRDVPEMSGSLRSAAG